MAMIDVIYVAACDIDARFTRICIASIRKYYPDIPVRLLAGAPLQRGLARELERHFNVGYEPLEPGNYTWGYVKLEALFRAPGTRFLMLDSDTVMTGPVLDAWDGSHAPFLVDEETLPEDYMKLLYYDWEKLRAAGHHGERPAFLFNSGQWFGTSGILTRADFDPWIEWTLPRRLRHPQFFKAGDQGILNYVVNRKVALEGLNVDRRKIMRWPGRGLEGFDAASVASGLAAPLVVHWAGMKKIRQREMVGADLLAYFERLYYRRLPFGPVRRLYDIWRA